MLLDIISPRNNVLNDQVTLTLVDICLTTHSKCYVNSSYALQKFGRLSAQKLPKFDFFNFEIMYLAQFSTDFDDLNI